MKINFDYYDPYIVETSDIENEILYYINNYSKEEYDSIIDKSENINMLLALSNIRENIIKWYNFSKNSSALEINSNFGEITRIFM